MYYLICIFCRNWVFNRLYGWIRNFSATNVDVSGTKCYWMVLTIQAKDCLAYILSTQIMKKLYQYGKPIVMCDSQVGDCGGHCIILFSMNGNIQWQHYKLIAKVG